MLCRNEFLMDVFSILVDAEDDIPLRTHHLLNRSSIPRQPFILLQ